MAQCDILSSFYCNRCVLFPQPNAQVAALEEMQRLQELGQEEQRERREQLEKARLRGNHALRREQLTQVHTATNTLALFKTIQVIT